MTFIRFVTLKIDENSHQPQGLFQVAYSLLRTGDLNAGEREEVQIIIDWFKKNLPIPNQPNVEGRAIFWYRDSALEHIQKMWSLANILQSHDCAIQVQKCRHLHNIVYQDDYQVAAYPHRHDGSITTN